MNNAAENDAAPMRAHTDGTQIWFEGRRFHILARELRQCHPDRPTVEHVRRAILNGRLKWAVHYLRLPNGRAVFADATAKVDLWPRPSPTPRYRRE